MGYLSDSLDFEKFFAKDLWSGIKKDPKRLVLGVDPASTWAWNKILGRDDKPLVDQMGGPYDGRVVSFGHGDGGVYDRAQAAGINTKSAAGNHDAAHMIAASYALGGGLGGNNGGGAGNADLFNNMPRTNFSTGMPSTGANPAAGIPGIAGPVGGGSTAGAGAGLGTMDYAKLGMSALGQVQQPQQQQPMAAPPQRQAAPFQPQTMGQRMNAGLGRVSNALFPMNPQLTAGMDPAYVQQMQNNAMLQLGLGMAAKGRQPGATFGSALGAGLGQAQGDLMGAMQTAYQNARQARADTRAESREDRLDARQQWLEDHTLDREKTQDERYQTEQDYRLKQADQAQKRWETEQAAQAQWRQDQLQERTMRAPPPGYRYKPDGSMEFIPGGPADPSVATNQRTLRPIPSAAAQGIVQNRTSIKQIDRALKALEENPEAFGMQNYLPDVATQRIEGKAYKGGIDARAQVADIGSLKIHDRSGAAVTAAEFPRLRPFIPSATDAPDVVKQKLQNLRANLQLMQEEVEGFYTPDAGYRPLPPQDGSVVPSAPPTMPQGLGQPQPGNVAQRAQGYY